MNIHRIHPALLDMTYIHEVDWTAGLQDFQWYYWVNQAGVNYPEGRVFEVAMLKVSEKYVLRSIINSLRKHNDEVIHMEGINPGYPKYVKMIVKGNVEVSTRYLAQSMGLIEAYAYYSNGIEHWGFITLNPKDADQFITSVSHYGKVLSAKLRALNINNSFNAGSLRLESLLNPSEYRILMYAFSRGFFNVPRSINVSELSSELKLSKSTIDRYLRSSLGKILKVIINNNEVTSSPQPVTGDS